MNVRCAQNANRVLISRKNLPLTLFAVFDMLSRDQKHVKTVNSGVFALESQQVAALAAIHTMHHHHGSVAEIL